MTNKDDKKKQALLQQQQAEDRARQQQAMASAAKPDPLEERFRARATNWFDVTEGKEGPFDVKNLTALRPNLQLYENAVANRAEDAQGQGLFSLGSNGANPLAVARLKEVLGERRKERAAGQLENAFNLTNAQMTGMGTNLYQAGNARNMGIAGLASGQSANSTGLFTQFQPRRSFLGDFILQGMQNAQRAAAMGAGGGA